METATAVTAARDARPCQLCEWLPQQGTVWEGGGSGGEGPCAQEAVVDSAGRGQCVGAHPELPGAWHQMKEQWRRGRKGEGP